MLVEVWKVLENVGIGWLKHIFYKVLMEEQMPEYWRKSFIVIIFKVKENIQEYNYYRGINLSHNMKIWEKIT